MSCEDERNTSDEQAHMASDRQQKRDFWHTGSDALCLCRSCTGVTAIDCSSSTNDPYKKKETQAFERKGGPQRKERQSCPPYPGKMIREHWYHQRQYHTRYNPLVSVQLHATIASHGTSGILCLCLPLLLCARRCSLAWDARCGNGVGCCARCSRFGLCLFSLQGALRFVGFEGRAAQGKDMVAESVCGIR